MSNPVEGLDHSYWAHSCLLDHPEAFFYRRNRGEYLESIINIDRVNCSKTEVDSEILSWWEKIEI